MLHRLRRHPFPVEAFFRHSLVITYAYPEELLQKLLPPGLSLDTYKGYGFLAIALVQTEKLRPAGFPAFLGQSFFLSGYRIFTRHKLASGQSLRGLKILRSDTDKGRMTLLGNLFTHYSYQKSRVRFEAQDEKLHVDIKTPNGKADLSAVADLSTQPASLPPGSPFASLEDAARFAGPLPFTFDYEHQTHSLVVVTGVRREWSPKPVAVEVEKNTFLAQPPFSEAKPLLANAFHLQDIPYRWTKGKVYPLPEEAL